MCPARCRLAMTRHTPRAPPRGPRRPVREPQQCRRRCPPEVVVAPARSSARRACVDGAGHVAEHQRLPGAVHGDRGGKRRGTRPRRRRPCPSAGPDVRGHPPPLASSHRSASRRRLDAVDLAGGQQRSGVPVAEHGPDPEQRRRGAPRSSAAASPPGGCCCMAGIASSTRSAARSKSSAASAWRIASDRSPFCSYQSLARRCSSGTWSGCSSSRRARSTSAKRWW